MKAELLYQKSWLIRSDLVRNKKSAVVYGCHEAVIHLTLRKLARHFETVVLSNHHDDLLEWLKDNTPSLLLLDDYFAVRAEVLVDRVKQQQALVLAMIDCATDRDYFHQVDQLFLKPLGWNEVKAYINNAGYIGCYETAVCK